MFRHAHAFRQRAIVFEIGYSPSQKQLPEQSGREVTFMTAVTPTQNNTRQNILAVKDGYKGIRYSIIKPPLWAIVVTCCLMQVLKLLVLTEACHISPRTSHTSYISQRRQQPPHPTTTIHPFFKAYTIQRAHNVDEIQL